MTDERIHLFDDYYFREATLEEFGPFFVKNRPKVFGETVTFPLDEWITDDEKAKLNLLGAAIQDRFFQRIFVLKNEEIIGWHVGRQVEADTYYMSNTGLFKEYRGKGIYTALLPKLLELYHDKGFQKVSSRHNASNNAVIVPKLKAGFMITGFEIDERFGLLLVLSYVFNAKRMKAYKFRTGELRPDEELKKYL